MADISTTHKTLDLRPQPVEPAQTSAATAAQPAAQLHGRQVSGPGVLDLRSQSQPAPASATPAPVAPAPGSVIAPPPVVAPPEPTPAPTPSVAAPVSTMPEVIIPEMPSVVAPPAEPEPIVATPEPATAPVSLMGPSSSGATPVNEPAPTPVVIPEPTPIAAPPVETPPAPVVAAATPTPEPIPQSPLIKKFPPHPAVAQAAADASNIAATHVDAMSAQAANAPAPPGPPQSPALKQALAAAKQSTAIPNVLKIGTAVIAIGAMAGLVWLQNSPKLAFHTAAAKAGIDASLPTYIPSSYHQTGPVTASAGVLTLQFANPSASSIKITQQQTNWDSNSLRDNYVSHQTDSFSAVQGQGLTIYLYGDEADWINHGVWYQITGASKLSRNELLKVAYGL